MKKFLVLGNLNAVTYQSIFPLFKNGMRWGRTAPSSYTTPDGTISAVLSRWYTTLKIQGRKSIKLSKTYNSSTYERYFNYEAVNCHRVLDIPYDYDGVMGVPITVLKYLCDDGHIHLGDTKYRLIGLGMSHLGQSIGVRGYTKEHRAFRQAQGRGTADGDLYLIRNGEVVVPYSRVLIQKVPTKSCL